MTSWTQYHYFISHKRKKMDKLPFNFTKIKNLGTPKDIIKKMKTYQRLGENIFKSYIYDKALVSRIYKESIQPNNNKNKQLSWKMVKRVNGYFTKEDLQVANKHVTRSSGDSPLGQWELKPPWDPNYIFSRKAIIKKTSTGDEMNADVKWESHFGKHWQFPLLDIHPREIKTVHTNTSVWTLVRLLLTTRKGGSRKQHKCSGADERIHKVLYIHTMEEYLATEVYKRLMPATTWINLKNVILSQRSQRSQTGETTSCVTPFTWNVQERPI